MNRDFQKEDEFYSKEFNFSYSSLNKLLYSPSLFYRDYILGDKEEKTEKYLVEGKLIHCLLFEPQNLSKKFNITPNKLPSDATLRVLNQIRNKSISLDIIFPKITDSIQELDDIILDVLKQENLHQSLKEDSARLVKIKTEEAQVYWEFINNPVGDIVDTETLEKCKTQVEILKANKDVMALFVDTESDFELDPIKSHSEIYRTAKLLNKSFGLHGIMDHYKVNAETKTVTIVDLKTTSKTISEFPETVEFYNYWLQAAIYYKLVFENLSKEEQEFKILFKFAVIDKYDQVYVFEVSDETMYEWGTRLMILLEQAEYHFTERDYSLPYNYLTNIIKL